MTNRKALASGVVGVLVLCVSALAQRNVEVGEGAGASLPARQRTESAASPKINAEVYERLANSEDGTAFVKITLEPPIPQLISTREERDAWYSERRAALLNSLTEGEHRDGWFEGDFQNVFRSGSVLFGFVSRDGLAMLANGPIRRVEQSKVGRISPVSYYLGPLLPILRLPNGRMDSRHSAVDAVFDLRADFDVFLPARGSLSQEGGTMHQLRIRSAGIERALSGM